MTDTQLQILIYVANHSECTAVAMAIETVFDLSTSTNELHNLRARGLVTCERKLGKLPRWSVVS